MHNKWIKFKIVQCKDPLLWYNKHIGDAWIANANQPDLDRYWVRDSDGYLNFVYKTDIEMGYSYFIKVTRCSNPILWYNDCLNREYEVVFETDAAYWVMNEPNKNAWIYKHDCVTV